MLLRAQYLLTMYALITAFGVLGIGLTENIAENLLYVRYFYSDSCVNLTSTCMP